MIETRSYTTPLHVRLSNEDQRIVAGIAAPFNELNKIAGSTGNFLERVQPGAFERTIRERGSKIKLLEQHDVRAYPLGIATLLAEREQGLYAEFRLANTDAGNQALTLVREGIVDGFSIGFQVISEKWSKKHIAQGLMVRDLFEIRLREISLVTFPAYTGATVTGSRNIPIRSYRDRLNNLKGLT